MECHHLVPGVTVIELTKVAYSAPLHSQHEKSTTILCMAIYKGGIALHGHIYTTHVMCKSMFFYNVLQECLVVVYT